GGTPIAPPQCCTFVHPACIALHENSTMTASDHLAKERPVPAPHRSAQQRSALPPSSRGEHLARLRAATAEQPLDVLVVGGGVNGAGAAFDAATRGLSVGLVETHDFASGTSSRSSKLMHGGLRYLQ